MPTPNIVNLLECESRRLYMERSLQSLGCDRMRFYMYERFENSGVEFIGHESIVKLVTKGVTSSYLITIKRWLENTDEEVGIFFEDDTDFSTVKYWNFTFGEFLERMGDKWDALHLCSIHETTPIMYPRKREIYDHGLQCCVLKRKYASRLVKYYFKDDEKTIYYKMPGSVPVSTENNILSGFGRVYTFPLFNHNIIEFKSENTAGPDHCSPVVNSYHFIKDWWLNVGSRLTLDDIFKNASL